MLLNHLIAFAFSSLAKNDCEKKLIFISLRARRRTGPTLVSVHTWPGNKSFISKS